MPAPTERERRALVGDGTGFSVARLRKLGNKWPVMTTQQWKALSAKAVRLTAIKMVNLMLYFTTGEQQSNYVILREKIPYLRTF